MSYFNILHTFIGFIGLIILAVPFSENYKDIKYKYIFYGILSQIILAAILLKLPFVISFFEVLGNGVTILQNATVQGASFVFGYPPAEAMAAGCRVIASDSAAHNEIIPNANLLPVGELRAWVDAIERIHTDWKRNLGEPRKPNLKLIEHVREILSPEAHGIALSNAYDLLFEE